MAYLLAALVGLAFGAGDQYLGTLVWLGSWTGTAAQVSAPWLVLPFVVGMTQQRARRAALLGLITAASALFGYYAMTYSPMEIHPWSLDRFADGMVSVTTTGLNPAYILGGLVGGPLFGLLGQRWRVRRWWVSGAIVAGVLCLEPAARSASGQLIPPAPVWTVEIVVGAVAAGLFVVAIQAWRREGRGSWSTTSRA